MHHPPRRIQLERLESRRLLAASVASNPINRLDANGDLLLDSQDILEVASALVLQEQGTAVSNAFVDTNRDGRLTTEDLIETIDHVIRDDVGPEISGRHLSTLPPEGAGAVSAAPSGGMIVGTVRDATGVMRLELQEGDVRLRDIDVSPTGAFFAELPADYVAADLNLAAFDYRGNETRVAVAQLRELPVDVDRVDSPAASADAESSDGAAEAPSGLDEFRCLRLASCQTVSAGADAGPPPIGDTASGAEQETAEAEQASAMLTIFVDGEQVTIPANIGVAAGGARLSQITSLANGQLALGPISNEPLGTLTVGDFFDTWRTSGGQAGNNPDAAISDSQVLGNQVGGGATIQMFVNGHVETAPAAYEIQDGDNIVLVYGDNPVVSLVTNFGSIVIELFPAETPVTVDNFLNYVNDGDYIDSFFHRNTKQFLGVLQGGGFRTDNATFTSTGQFFPVPSGPPIVNEPGLSNVRSTIAMAKFAALPDSATSQFYFNFLDNTGLDSPANSGGFTVFGHVLDMTTVDQISGFTNRAEPSPFSELPVSDSDQLAVIQQVAGQGRVEGEKFIDENENGIKDFGEQALAGATVYADLDGDGQRDAGEPFAITEADGRYFLQLEPSDYLVRSEVLGGGMDTTPGGAVQVTVEIGRSASAEFSESFVFAAGASLSGYVYVDSNNDGIRDVGEEGVPGVEIAITNGVIISTTLTDVNGFYAFNNLLAGNYLVQEMQPSGLVDGKDTLGNLGGSVSNNDEFSVTLSGGDSGVDYNFGELPADEGAVILNGRRIFFIGTGLSDVVDVYRHGDQYIVFASFLPGRLATFHVDDVDSIAGRMGAGHDVFHIQHGLNLPADVEGESGHDVLIGAGGNDILDGGEGWDVIFGWGGNDELRGRSGGDQLFGGDGDDMLDGGDGDDHLFGDAGQDHLNGGQGVDFLFGGRDDDVVLGGAGVDFLFGLQGNDSLWGEAGDDYLFGGENDDLLNGGAGNDFLFAELGDDRLLGGTGRDTLFGYSGRNTLIGGPDLDRLFGDADDTLIQDE